MLKKSLYIALSVIFCCLTVRNVSAQVALSLPQANITGQTNYVATAVATGSSGALSLLSSIYGQSGQSTFTSAPSTLPNLPLSIASFQVSSIGGINLLSGSSAITFTTSPQTIYYVLLGLGGGVMNVNYTVITPGTIWAAGTYTIPMIFTPAGKITPGTQNLAITVPAFIALNTQIPATTTLNVNSLALFRSVGGVSSAANNYDYFTTVPTLFSLNTNSSTFSFSTTQPYNSLPAANNVNLMSALISGPYAGSAINLSTTSQLLTVGTGVPVILTNKSTTYNSTLSISGANLKSNFVQAGTYTVPAVYTVAKTAAAFPSTLASQTMNTSVQVNVSNIMELVVQDPSVTLTVNTAALYAQGTSTQMPNHVKVSSTVPYNVTVQASSSTLSSSGGVQIPVGVITIQGMTGQTGITPVVLSASPQALMTSANPVIDNFLSLQYTIPSSQTANLLNKAAGSYSTTITYTIVAP